MTATLELVEAEAVFTRTGAAAAPAGSAPVG